MKDKDMQFMTTGEAAQKWKISDRRVRIICSEGKIKGCIKSGKSYKIPLNANKPEDGRVKNRIDNKTRFLKWDNDIVGIIDQNNAVSFAAPEYNDVVKQYTKGYKSWTPEQFTEFLSERVVSRDRRDIEKILFRCGLSHYDVLRISEIIRGIHPKDLLWIAFHLDETLQSIMSDVFDSVFNQKTDLVGDSIDTPEGYNIKRYGVYNNKYGIYKQRISPLATDVESEVAVFLLSEKLGVPCCPAYRVDKDNVFSEFLFDFSKEYIVHFRRLFEGKRSNNEYKNLISVRPQYKEEIAKMILLDFITRQDDRHLSNIAIKINSKGESFYPLYDNGRSLFYEDTEEMVKQAVKNPKEYATGFGFSGTYYDYVEEIAAEYGDFNKLINLNISRDDVADILKKAGFTGYRFKGALEWILKTIDILKKDFIK